MQLSQLIDEFWRYLRCHYSRNTRAELFAPATMLSKGLTSPLLSMYQRYVHNRLTTEITGWPARLPKPYQQNDDRALLTHLLVETFSVTEHTSVAQNAYRTVLSTAKCVRDSPSLKVGGCRFTEECGLLCVKSGIKGIFC